MDPITQQGLAGSAGASGDPVYVDDVFSTFLYEGTGSAQTITNGIDLSGEGGLVWTKNRQIAYNHNLFDTERGLSYIETSTNSDKSNNTGGVTSYNTNGYNIGSFSGVNENSTSYKQHVSWTFRKAKGFFDIVTYTGDGSSNRAISHNLGSVPGMIWVKNLDGFNDWQVYHRSMGPTKYLRLNLSANSTTGSGRWNNTNPTSTHFTIANDGSVNYNGNNYVAYLFAHDAEEFGTNADESIIKCGTYTGNGITNNSQVEQLTAPNIDLGWEPQWVMLRSADSQDDWWMFDTMRNFSTNLHGPHDNLYANSTNGEGNNISSYYPRLKLTSTGFKITAGQGVYFNYPGQQYIYMAIRRPHKPPTAGTEVFEPVARVSSNPNLFSTALNHVDAVWSKLRYNTTYWLSTNRLTAPKYMHLNATDMESTGSLIHYDYNYKIDPSSMSSGQSQINYLFKRAPGFFDVVTYTGNNTNRTINHNLGVAPEFILVKGRDFADSWAVYNKISGATITNTFTSSSNFYASSTRWNDTEPTSTVFSLGTDNSVNKNGATHLAYLFASLDGISKVGSYTGTGNNVNVDCGFTAGARFVMVKRMDNNGNWYVWDTARGIVSGNDPYMSFNTTYADDSGIDFIDPLNAGFTITSSANYHFNASGVNYLFLAIA